MDRNEAIKATKNGAIAAMISGLFTLGVVAFALYSNADGELGFWNDPSNFIDVAVLFLFAFGIYRKSRAAAVILFLYFIIAKITIGISIGRVPGLFLSLIFLYYFGKAVQGTYVFHRLERAENPDYKTSPRWYYWVGIPLGLLMAIAIGIGTLSMTGAIPSTEVLAGSKVPANQIQTLLSENIINEGETIEYFYSAGFTSILDDGNLLTDRRVISYSKNGTGEMEIYELYIPEIRDVELVQEGDFLNESVYQVNSYDEEAWLQVILSTESQGDVRFVEALRKMIDEDE